MSWIKCHLCALPINTDAEPDCWRKSVHPDKWTKPGQPGTYPDIALCMDCREYRDARQDRRQAKIAGRVDILEPDEDIDGPPAGKLSRRFKKGIL